MGFGAPYIRDLMVCYIFNFRLNVAFVHFHTAEEGLAAVEATNGVLVDGHPIEVKVSIIKPAKVSRQNADFSWFHVSICMLILTSGKQVFF